MNKALLIFLVLALLLVVAGLFFPSKTRKSPLNDRDLRQGDTARWIERIGETIQKDRNEKNSR